MRKRTLFPKTRKADWFTDPKMVGHTWSKEYVEYADKALKKFAKTPFQVKFIQKVITDTPHWHYWNLEVTKKYIHAVRYAVRRVSKCLVDAGAMSSLLSHHNRKAGRLKSQLTWALELLAYKHDYHRYLENYTRAYGFYGMSKEDAEERFDEYHARILIKHP